MLVKTIGPNRIMLGSDYPFPLGETQPGKLVRENMVLSETEKEQILGLNVLDFLGLDYGSFI